MEIEDIGALGDVCAKPLHLLDLLVFVVLLKAARPHLRWYDERQMFTERRLWQIVCDVVDRRIGTYSWHTLILT